MNTFNEINKILLDCLLCIISSILDYNIIMILQLIIVYQCEEILSLYHDINFDHVYNQNLFPNKPIHEFTVVVRIHIKKTKKTLSML